MSKKDKETEPQAITADQIPDDAEFVLSKKVVDHLINYFAKRVVWADAEPYMDMLKTARLHKPEDKSEENIQCD